MFYFIYQIDEQIKERMLDYFDKLEKQCYIVKDERGFRFVKLTH